MPLKIYALVSDDLNQLCSFQNRFKFLDFLAECKSYLMFFHLKCFYLKSVNHNFFLKFDEHLFVLFESWSFFKEKHVSILHEAWKPSTFIFVQVYVPF